MRKIIITVTVIALILSILSTGLVVIFYGDGTTIPTADVSTVSAE